MLSSLYHIDNLEEFKQKIRSDAIEIFLLSYKESKHFIEKYNDQLISIDDVQCELKNYIFIKNNEYYIDNEQIENVTRSVYQQLVFKILSKLVDDGILEMCWDSEMASFIWRKKKYARIGKIKK